MEKLTTKEFDDMTTDIKQEWELLKALYNGRNDDILAIEFAVAKMYERLTG